MNRSAVQFYRSHRALSLHENRHGRSHFPYIYRRETSLSSSDKDGHPNLTISGKLREKENFVFGGVPNFYSLPEDDRTNTKSTPGIITREDLLEYAAEEKRKKEKRKEKKKNVPTNNEVRERLRIISKYHKKMVEESMPCPYPLLGPAGESDSDSDNEDDNTKRRNKKCENSDSKPILPIVRSGRKNSNPIQTKAPPKKRGKK